MTDKELMQPEQEPVAHVYLFDPNGKPRVAWDNAKSIKIGTKLYTAPQRPEWIGLTDEDRYEFAAAQYGWEDLLIAAEAKLREKNA